MRVMLVVSVLMLMTMVIMMMRALLMTSFLAKMIVMFGWFMMSFLLLSSLFVSRRFVEVSFAFIKTVDINSTRWLIFTFIKKEVLLLTLHRRPRRRISSLSWNRLIYVSHAFPWLNDLSWMIHAPPICCLTMTVKIKKFNIFLVRQLKLAKVHLSLPFRPFSSRDGNHLQIGRK